MNVSAKASPSSSSCAPPAFADVVEARFRAQLVAATDIQADAFRATYVELRRRFEEAKGKIEREYWGVQLPLGLVLTERPRNRLKRWLRRPPTMHLHHGTSHLGSMPVRFHAALQHGDMLAVRAGWSLGDLSRHTVLDRIFDVQAFLFTIADNAGGKIDELETGPESHEIME